MYSANSSFTINPDEYMLGYDTLTLVMYTNSGTGSLADKVDAEGYKVARKWLVVIDGRPAPQVTVTAGITPQGYLKLSWPKCYQYNFHKYDFHFSNHLESYQKSIFDADSTCIIDSCYIGGEASCFVNTLVYGNDSYGYGKQLHLNEPPPNLKFEEKGFDSLRIYWNKAKYQATYQLYQQYVSQDSAIFESHTDTSITIAGLGIGNLVYFTLKTLPFRPCSNNASYNNTNIVRYVLGSFIEGNWPEFGYNRQEKMLYSNTYDEVHGYDINTLTLQKKRLIHDMIYMGKYACPTNSSKIAVMSKDSIYLFPDKNLQNPLKIPLDNPVYQNDHFYLTDNNVLAIARPYSYEQIRLSDQQVIVSIPIADYPVYSSWACITTSRDGKYACVVTRNGLQLYAIENGVASTIYSDTRDYRSALFDDSTDECLMLSFTGNSTLEFRKASDFSLLKSFSLPGKGEVLCNIDPESGYLLTTDYKYSYVVDINNGKLKLNTGPTDYRPKLYGNKFFSGDGYWVDISKYLNK
jgi:hypothetical protein